MNTTGRDFWSVPRVLTALTAVGVLLAALSSQYCRVNGWGGVEVYHWGCYSDVSALWASRDFDQSAWAPFNENYSTFEYPSLTMFLASVMAALTHGFDGVFGSTAVDYWGDRTGLLYWDLTFLVSALAWFVLTLAVMKSAGARPWNAVIVALSPAIIFGIGINWDIWPAAALALGLLFWQRRQWVLAGVLVGIGVSFKIYPLFLLGAAFVLALRTALRRDGEGAGTEWPAFGKLAVSAAGAWLIINVPVMLISFESWARFFIFSSERGAGWSSIWHVWGVVTETGVAAQTVSTWSFLLFAASCAAVLVIGLTARQRPGVAQLLLLIVAAFMIFNKVYSPQFMLWLVPLIALAVPRIRDVLIWHGFQLLHFWAVWMYLAASVGDYQTQHSFDENLYVVAVAGHVLSTVYLCALVIRDIYQPSPASRAPCPV